MSSDTTIICEQPLPFGIRLLSRVSTFTGFVESILSIFILWLCPSLAPKAPAFRPPPKQPKNMCRVRASSLSSVASTTSTLVDSSETSEEKEEGVESKEVPDQMPKRQLRLSLPFTNLSVQTPLHTPHISHAPHISIRPLARRMSTTGRQFASSIHTPFMHTAPEWNAASYFSPRQHADDSIEPLEVEEIQVVQETSMVETCVISVAEVVEDEAVETVEEQVKETSVGQGVKKVTKAKLISHKVKSLLRYGYVHKSQKVVLRT